MLDRLHEGKYEYEKSPDILFFSDDELSTLQTTLEFNQLPVYLYHGIPRNMRGGILYPLNQLKSVFPDIYEQHKMKYDWRPEVMKERIPYLNCLWNDVIFLTAVNPRDIRQALEDAGGTAPEKWRCYQIDPYSLDPGKTVIGLRPHEVLSDDNCIVYSPDQLRQCMSLPQETVDYYKKAVVEGKQPLLYHRIPHILYEGSIDVQSLAVFDV